MPILSPAGDRSRRGSWQGGVPDAADRDGIDGGTVLASSGWHPRFATFPREAARQGIPPAAQVSATSRTASSRYRSLPNETNDHCPSRTVGDGKRLAGCPRWRVHHRCRHQAPPRRHPDSPPEEDVETLIREIRAGMAGSGTAPEQSRRRQGWISLLHEEVNGQDQTTHRSEQS